MKLLKVVRGVDATLKHVKEAIEIDKLIYPNNLHGVYDTCVKWFNKNPRIYTFLVDEKEDKVVGYVNAMPISRRLYRKIIQGRVNDSQINEKDILPYKPESVYNQYFCSLAVHPSYEATQAFNLLYNAYIEEMILLAKDKVFIDKILAEGVTKKGSRICRLSGLEPVSTTISGNPLYGLFISQQIFNPISSTAEKLQQLYMKSIR